MERVHTHFRCATGFFLLLFLPLLGWAQDSDVGWRLAAALPSEWNIEAGTATLSHTSGGVSVSLPPNQSIVLELRTEPIWVYRFPNLTLSIEQSGLIASSFGYRDDSISPTLPSRWIDAFAITNGTNSYRFPAMASRQINRLRFTLRSGNNAAQFHIKAMQFTGQDESRFPLREEPGEIIRDADLVPITLSGGTVPLNGNDAALASGFSLSGIPFQAPGDQRMLATDHGQRGAITIPIQRSCREVFLLMGVDLSGTDAAFSFIERTKVSQTERLVVQCEYSDGSVDESFPLDVQRGTYAVSASELAVYAIPVRSHLPLRSIRIVERMSFGRVVLAAVTCNIGPTRRASWPETSFPQRLEIPSGQINPATTTIQSPDDDTFILKNDAWAMQWDTSRGLLLESITHARHQENSLAQPSPLFAVIANGLPIPADAWTVTEIEPFSDRIALTLQSTASGTRLLASVIIRPGTDDECGIDLALTNTDSTDTTLRLLFPTLQSVRISKETQNDWYVFPRKRVAWDNTATSLSAKHAGMFPFQWMSTYSSEYAVGISVHTRDLEHKPKQFRLRKTDARIDLGVEYGYRQPLRLASGETYHPAPAVLQMHDGDWFAAMKSYKRWTSTWAPTVRAATQSWISYRPREIATATEIERASAALGGIGLVNHVADDIHYATAFSPNTMYTVDGYRITDASPTLEEPSTLAPLLDNQGTQKTWPGTSLPMMNPGSPEWQQNRSQAIAEIVTNTMPRAIYLDTIGFANDDLAGHFWSEGQWLAADPVSAEASLLQHLRETTPQDVLLFTEEIPSDATLRFIDGAYSYSKLGTRAYTSPAHLNLFRYAFPSHAIYERVDAGVFPKAMHAEAAKLAFVHGSGIMLDHPIHAGYSREFRDFIRNANETFTDYAETFNSRNVEPLISTTMHGVYANRFSTDTHDLYLLINSGMHTQRGRTIQINAGRDAITNLWDTAGFSVASAGNETTEVFLQLHPYEVAVLSVDR